ncbi:type III secretion system ATPase SctN [Paracidovorax citrulli]|uniref:protein-secreting ATPase n=1 Tax=Paracidovorax citrulli TaxID=80869 RepID=F5CIR3_PARCI|nr:type III secretion system ATPase SctN [Paracidovorax citrulli]AEC13712.1 non-flagellar type III secretion system ATPase [Paracidovorax citrulli]QCX11145.1 EscN/YscN/HrcN family type III secretion system ATPase [Paracidovorax citrulli]UEG45883.1 type III secretion system ATPase SctN [Paracidovorax citrulli]UMT86821.1 EscN/YscN/HrcN family type III secretion system ATPase [Paracidovorax citrulli]UMT94862.1 EscN/YscN/HrcN family type III secretion system ATPase [Paracidovorax citrulli]
MHDVNGTARIAHWMEREIASAPLVRRSGKVAEVIGTLMRVNGLDAKLGELCHVLDERGELLQAAEVVGFANGQSILSPFGSILGVRGGSAVVGLGEVLSVPVGPRLLGRVIDSLGQPIDGKGPLDCSETRPVFALPPTPMEREMIEHPLPTGVKAIDGLITLGEGQRMGIFAPAGVGKSTLMGMLARGTQCDVSVIALIGERGREVREFVEFILGEEGMARSVVVCATSDRSSSERAKAAHVATAVAEYYRDQGLKVLLMMDSLTRFARAQREIGLAAGEPPARRGFPPSVFAEIPRLLERAGMGARGSITALYTVLYEDESGNDPISEEVRGILDGHMILSRKIAARNQYPAIDVLGSLSRVMSQIVPREHQQAGGRFRQLMAKYEEIEPLVQMGEYRPGNDPLADEAMEKHAAIRDFLNQSTSDLWDFGRSVDTLADISG